MKHQLSGGRTFKRPPSHPLRTALLFSGLSRPVAFSGCPLLLRQARLFFYGWPSDECSRDSSPIIRVRASAHESSGYTIHAPWLKTAVDEPTMATALCSLAIEMVAAFCEEHPHVLCLHAAAAKRGEHTLLLLGDNHAGKSTLLSRLLADGWTSLGDDLIGVMVEGKIMSFGIPLRLRLPLPPSSELARFVHSCGGIRDGRYLHLRTEPHSAPFGTISSPTHILVLQRRSRIKAELLPLKRLAGLIRLMPHYVMRTGSAESTFRYAAELMHRTSASLFRYDDLDEAAALLRQFSECGLSQPRAYVSSGKGRTNIPEVQPVIQTKEHVFKETQEQYIRSSNVRTFHEYGRAFLVNQDTDIIYGLNRTGELLWSLLADPLSEKEATLFLHRCFPGTDRERIRRDMSSLFRELKEKRLIRHV